MSLGPSDMTEVLRISLAAALLFAILMTICIPYELQLQRRESELDAAKAERERLRGAVEAYERMHDVRLATAGEMQRAARLTLLR
jgi:hypothetical protein